MAFKISNGQEFFGAKFGLSQPKKIPDFDDIGTVTPIVTRDGPTHVVSYTVTHRLVIPDFFLKNHKMEVTAENAEALAKKAMQRIIRVMHDQFRTTT